MFLRVLALKCPFCGKAGLSAGFFKTHKSCTSCASVFEKEAGFFVGAIYPFYFLTGVTAIGAMLLGVFVLGLGTGPAFALACLVALPLTPYYFQVSRAFFVMAEHRFFSRIGN